MWSLLLVVLAIFVVAGWARSVRAGRLQWLERLSLPGTWRCEDPGTTLELRGALAGGDYVETWATGMERGQWQLHGHTLTLTATRVPPRDAMPALAYAGVEVTPEERKSWGIIEID